MGFQHRAAHNLGARDNAPGCCLLMNISVQSRLQAMRPTFVKYWQESFLKAGSLKKALEKEVQKGIILGCRCSISDVLLRSCQQEHCARNFWCTDNRSGKSGTWRSIQTSIKTEKVVSAPKAIRAVVSELIVSNTQKIGIAADGG